MDAARYVESVVLLYSDAGAFRELMSKCVEREISFQKPELFFREDNAVVATLKTSLQALMLPWFRKGVEKKNHDKSYHQSIIMTDLVSFLKLSSIFTGK